MGTMTVSTVSTTVAAALPSCASGSSNVAVMRSSSARACRVASSMFIVASMVACIMTGSGGVISSVAAAEEAMTMSANAVGKSCGVVLVVGVAVAVAVVVVKSTLIRAAPIKDCLRACPMVSVEARLRGDKSSSAAALGDTTGSKAVVARRGDTYFTLGATGTAPWC